APPKAAPQAAAEAAEEAADQQLPDGRPWHRRWLAATPSWLVSLVIHLALIVLLALLVVPAPKQALGTLLEAVTSELEEVELLEPMKMEMVELQTPEMATTSVTAVEVTSTSLADAADLSSVAANLSPGDVEVPASSEIGDLFVGGGGKAMGNVLPSGADKSAQFFGVKASGRRFVFIVDSSNSMRGGKFDAAKEELMYAIRRLSKEQAFYIIFFDQNAERMRLPPSTEPELLPVPAVNENINRAEKWVGTVANELRTDPYDAVKFAIDMVPDAIYLLTDGKFTDRGLTERYLKNNNIIDDPLEGRRPKVVIHTICFWQKDGELALQAIAKDYGGTYRFVPPARGMMKKK
ncbi:MAG TPA: VWA domain-containing protein, partial [Pirellulaceae bacterium]|nr:VWA domain-containing protein [Pirellulaceae bacterium]